MNRFSASEAALEGFRLTRERPGTILAWAAVYAAAMAVIGKIMFSSLGPEAMQLARKGSLSPDDAEAIAGKLAESAPAFLLVLLLAVALTSVITGGIYRLVLRPQEKGLAYLRLGPDELRLTLVNLLLFAVGMVCLFTGFVAIAAAEQTGSPLGFIVAPLVLALTVWVGVRLSLVTPMTFATRRISLRAGWELTRGRFWSLFGMIVLAVIFYVMVWLLISIIGIAIVSLAGGDQGFTDLTHMNPGQLVAGAATLLMQLVLSVLQLVMIYAPFAVAYQQLHGDAPANPLRTHAKSV
jgi:hypothetical protein